MDLNFEQRKIRKKCLLYVYVVTNLISFINERTLIRHYSSRSILGG